MGAFCCRCHLGDILVSDATVCFQKFSLREIVL